jgi:CDP-ribitol ribitolphosphotransferase
VVRIAFAIGRLLPLRRRVVLGTAHAGRLSGNLEWIRRDLLRRGVPVVALTGTPRKVPGGRLLHFVELLRAGYHLATARVVVVDDYYFPMYAIRRRPGTAYAQVWHACGALKKFGYSVLEKSFGLDEDLARAVPMHVNYDVCLVSAMRFAPFYAEAFRQPLERFTSQLGIPRTDVFFDERMTNRLATTIRDRYVLPRDRRVVLYAPTFRGDRIGDARSPETLDLAVLHERLGDDHVLLLRDHPFVSEARVIGPELAGFVIDVSDWPEINELMLVSDVLVTDYSSAIFEFALLGRPMAFFAPDHVAYERERGLYVDFESFVPGPLFETTEALADYIRAGVFDLDPVRRFAAEAFDVADGRATERFVDRVVLPALAGRPPQVAAPSNGPRDAVTGDPR